MKNDDFIQTCRLCKNKFFSKSYNDYCDYCRSWIEKGVHDSRLST